MTGVGAPTEIALHHVILRKEDSLIGGSKYRCAFCKGSEDAIQRCYVGINQYGSIFIGMEMGEQRK